MPLDGGAGGKGVDRLGKPATEEAAGGAEVEGGRGGGRSSE